MQTDEIEDHLNDFMSTLQELKIDCGISIVDSRKVLH